MNAGELGAAADVLDLLAELLNQVHVGVTLPEYVDAAVERLSLVKVTLASVGIDLRVAIDYPQLPDAPQRDLEKHRARLREAIAAGFPRPERMA